MGDKKVIHVILFYRCMEYLADSDGYIKPRPNVKSRGQDGGGISMDKYENQNQGNMKGQYLKLNAHFCSAASHVCPRHLTRCTTPSNMLTLGRPFL